MLRIRDGYPVTTGSWFFSLAVEPASAYPLAGSDDRVPGGAVCPLRAGPCPWRQSRIDLLSCHSSGVGDLRVEGGAGRPGPVGHRWRLLVSALIGFRGGERPHPTKPETRAPSRALPRRRALCTNWKKPRYSGSFFCEMPRCGRSQERSSDQKPSMVLTCTSQKPSPSSSRAYSPRAWQTVLCG